MRRRAPPTDPPGDAERVLSGDGGLPRLTLRADRTKRGIEDRRAVIGVPRDLCDRDEHVEDLPEARE